MQKDFILGYLQRERFSVYFGRPISKAYRQSTLWVDIIAEGSNYLDCYIKTICQ